MAEQGWTEDDMRRRLTILTLAALCASCGGDIDTNAPPTGTPELDAPLIATAQQLSDALGGCTRIEGAEPPETKVVSLESASIVMIGCSQSEYAYTSRLFLMGNGGQAQLLTVPDYDADGWFATDQPSLPEIDAGSGTLTTYRTEGDNDVCGAEGLYAWNGKRFVVEEMRWRACDSANQNGPPYPVIWPTQNAPAVVPDDTTPAP
jgi:hypothetical protein